MARYITVHQNGEDWLARDLRSAVTDLGYQFAAYGIRNPLVAERISGGADPDACTGCGGQGRRFLNRPWGCKCGSRQAGQGQVISGRWVNAVTETRRSIACPDCTAVCGECRGTGQTPVLPVCVDDFLPGDETSRRYAALIGVEVDSRRQRR